MIELLVVIAVIAILAALLLPALNLSKARAQAYLCLHDNKQLGLAWTMYSYDNNDQLACNTGANPAMMSFAPSTAPNWVNNVMDWDLSPANTNLDFVNHSLLGEYVAKVGALFHCPSDRAVSSLQKSAGWTSRARSISMNGMVGDPGGAILQSGTNTINPQYQQFLKDSDFPDPSSIFVFLDEHPDSINDGYFLNPPENNEWLDLPGSYHNGGGSFSFADGHTEIHRWRSASTIRSNTEEGFNGPILLRSDDLVDFNWVNQHASVLRR